MPSVQKNQPEPNLFEGAEFVTVRAVPAKAAAPKVEVTKATDKAPNAYRTISEVAADLDVPQHVLRFWETKFLQLKPLKRGGGRRYYRTEDIAFLHRIHTLLYSEGYTIKGAQKLLATPAIKVKKAEKPTLVVKEAAASREVLLAMLKELRELRALV